MPLGNFKLFQQGQPLFLGQPFLRQPFQRQLFQRQLFQRVAVLKGSFFKGQLFQRQPFQRVAVLELADLELAVLEIADLKHRLLTTSPFLSRLVLFLSFIFLQDVIFKIYLFCIESNLLFFWSFDHDTVNAISRYVTRISFVSIRTL